MAGEDQTLALVVETLKLLTQRFEAMNTSILKLQQSVQHLTELLVEFEDTDPAAFSLDGPVENRTRDPNQPL